MKAKGKGKGDNSRAAIVVNIRAVVNGGVLGSIIETTESTKRGVIQGTKYARSTDSVLTGSCVSSTSEKVTQDVERMD